MTYPTQYQQPQQFPFPAPQPQQQGHMPYQQTAFPPQQGYTQQPPAQPAAPVSMGDFFAQRSSAHGKALKFPVVNTTHAGIVARALVDGDFEQETAYAPPGAPAGAPLTNRDGSPRVQMRLPLLVQPSPDYPDGQATLYVKQGKIRDELARAMAEAGAPTGAPEAGAGIVVTFTHETPSRVGNPAKHYRIAYHRPDGAANAPAVEPTTGPAAAVAAPVEPTPVPQPAPAPAPMPAPQQAEAPAVPQDPAKAALLARLTGAAQPAQG